MRTGCFLPRCFLPRDVFLFFFSILIVDSPFCWPGCFRPVLSGALLDALDGWIEMHGHKNRYGIEEYEEWIYAGTL